MKCTLVTAAQSTPAYIETAPFGLGARRQFGAGTMTLAVAACLVGVANWVADC